MLSSDRLSAYRVFPRLFSIFYLYLIAKVAFWFMALETPSIEQSAFASMMATTGAAWFKFYVEGGKQ